MAMSKVSLIFSSLLQLARSVGSVPDEVVRELVQCGSDEIGERLAAAGADVIGARIPDDVPRAIADVLARPPEPELDANSEVDVYMDTRPFVIELRGMPAERVEPTLRFILRDGRWRFERFSTPSRRHDQLNRIPPFTLNCAVCEERNLAEEIRPEMHGVMTAWAGIRLLVCARCASRVRTPEQMPPGACFCCMSAGDDVQVYQRTDNYAVLALCSRCTASKWLQVMETAGITLRRTAFPRPLYRNLALNIVAHSPAELAQAYEASRKRPAEEALPDAKRVDRKCCAAAPAAWCAADECEESACAGCLTERYGQLAPMYYEPVRLWRCGSHFPTSPPAQPVDAAL